MKSNQVLSEELLIPHVTCAMDDSEGNSKQGQPKVCWDCVGFHDSASKIIVIIIILQTIIIFRKHNKKKKTKKKKPTTNNNYFEYIYILIK